MRRLDALLLLTTGAYLLWKPNFDDLSVFHDHGKKFGIEHVFQFFLGTDEIQIQFTESDFAIKEEHGPYFSRKNYDDTRCALLDFTGREFHECGAEDVERAHRNFVIRTRWTQ